MCRGEQRSTHVQDITAQTHRLTLFSFSLRLCIALFPLNTFLLPSKISVDQGKIRNVEKHGHSRQHSLKWMDVILGAQ